MKASIVDLRRRMGDVLRALERNECVSIQYHGKEKGVIYPPPAALQQPAAIRSHPAFGMWRERADMKDVARTVRKLRKNRASGL